MVSATGILVNKDSMSYETSSSSSAMGAFLRSSGNNRVLFMTYLFLANGWRYFEIILEARWAKVFV